MAWYQRKFSFTLDARFGFGILFDKEEGETYRQCFYEGGRLAPAKGLPDLYGAVEAFRRYSSHENDYLSPSEAQNEQSASNQSSCTFQPGPDHSVIAILKTTKESVQVTSSKGTYYSFSARCNCKNRMCHHERDAADFLDLRLARLMHEYIISDLTTDKTVFLDPYLRSMIVNIQIREPNIEAVRYVRQILSLIRAANSEPYYWLFHNYLLQLDPAYDYSATFLQDLFTEIMLALFDDPGYQQTVLSTDHYAEPESYEGRQRRSNRTCLKRVLKEYQRAIKAMDQKTIIPSNTQRNSCSNTATTFRASSTISR